MLIKNMKSDLQIHPLERNCLSENRIALSYKLRKMSTLLGCVQHSGMMCSIPKYHRIFGKISELQNNLEHSGTS